MKHLSFIAAVSILFMGCSNVPQSVRDGYELPTTLEMCHSVFVDANDANYLKDLRIKELEKQVEDLKTSK